MIRLPRAVPQTAAELSRGLASGRALRLVNYHSTPHFRADEFRREVAAFAKGHTGLDAAGLERFMQGETPARPIIIPVLFEGFRDNYDVILPIIEDHDLTAWFFIPPAFIDVPADEQRPFAERHTLVYPHDGYPGSRIAMSWPELRDVHARGHLVACHSRSHTELTPDTPDDILNDEIVLAKQEFDDKLGAPVEMFCYLRGAEHGLNTRADSRLASAGYRYLLSNFRLQKLQ